MCGSFLHVRAYLNLFCLPIPSELFFVMVLADVYYLLDLFHLFVFVVCLFVTVLFVCVAPWLLDFRKRRRQVMRGESNKCQNGGRMMSCSACWYCLCTLMGSGVLAHCVTASHHVSTTALTSGERPPAWETALLWNSCPTRGRWAAADVVPVLTHRCSNC